MPNRPYTFAGRLLGPLGRKTGVDRGSFHIDTGGLNNWSLDGTIDSQSLPSPNPLKTLAQHHRVADARPAAATAAAGDDGEASARPLRVSLLLGLFLPLAVPLRLLRLRLVPLPVALPLLLVVVLAGPEPLPSSG